MGRLSRFAVVVGIGGLAATVLVAVPVGATSYPPPTHRGPHVMRMTTNPAPQTAAASNAHLTYYGGRVLSNAQVEDVYWGPGTYESNVGSGGSMPNFFNAVGGSAYFDWLTEYNTNRLGNDGGPGSNQTIGHAAYVADDTITPSSANDQQTIDDTNIQAELKAQLDSGGLPAPKTDSQGNDDSLYALFFPQGKKLTTASSGTGGVQWCAYHGTINYNGLSVPYMVLPDFADTTQPGISYMGGCGGDPSTFNNFTSVTSHELGESVTDTEIGLTSTVGRPIAWYDPSNGEIGDICNAVQGSIVGYTVQKLWSNQDNACIVDKPAANDFSIAVSPSSMTAEQTNSASATVTTALTTGSAQTINLKVSGLPAGSTAGFSPSVISSGDSSTLTVNAGTAKAGTYTLTITGNGSNATHTTTASFTVTLGPNDFSISASPTSLSVAPTKSGTVKVTTAVLTGMAEQVTFAVSGLPSGATGSFVPTAVNSGGQSTLTINSGSAIPGVSTVTITGTALTGSHATTITLTVTRYSSRLVTSALHTTGNHPTARLTRVGTNAPLFGQTITFSSSLSGTCSAVTNANGIAACTTTFLEFNGFTAKFAGNSLYLPTSATGAN